MPSWRKCPFLGAGLDSLRWRPDMTNALRRTTSAACDTLTCTLFSGYDKLGDPSEAATVSPHAPPRPYRPPLSSLTRKHEPPPHPVEKSPLANQPPRLPPTVQVLITRLRAPSSALTLP